MKTGDVVKVKSGSDPMTVLWVDNQNDVQLCWWNYENRSFSYAKLTMDALEIVKD